MHAKGVGEAASRTLMTAQLQVRPQRCFFKTNGNSAAVLVFQNQHSKRRSSVAFSKLALETPQECSFFKTNAGNSAAVLVFQNQHSKRRSSVAFSKLTLETPQECSFFKTNTGNSAAVFALQN